MKKTIWLVLVLIYLMGLVGLGVSYSSKYKYWFSKDVSFVEMKQMIETEGVSFNPHALWCTIRYIYAPSDIEGDDKSLSAVPPSMFPVGVFLASAILFLLAVMQYKAGFRGGLDSRTAVPTFLILLSFSVIYSLVVFQFRYVLDDEMGFVVMMILTQLYILYFIKLCFCMLVGLRSRLS